MQYYFFFTKKITIQFLHKSQFNYCPLVGCFAQNRKINSIHERSLRKKDYKNSYSDILDLHREKTIHQFNRQYISCSMDSLHQ